MSSDDASECTAHKIVSQSAKLELPADDSDDEADTAVVPVGAGVVAHADGPPSLSVRTMHSVSSGIEYGGAKLAAGVTQTGQWLAKGVGATGSSIRSRLAPVRVRCFTVCS